MNNSLGIEFLDRFDERRELTDEYNGFKDKVNDKNNSKLVLNYFGCGGIGKSEFMQKMKKELQRNNKDCLVIRWDLGKFTCVAQALFKMKELLVNECGFKFPEMDLAQYIYEYIDGKKPDFPKSQKFIDKNVKMRICDQLFGDLPVIGVLFKTAKLWDEVYAIMKDEDNRLKLAQLKDDAPGDLQDNLRDLFIEELNANLKIVNGPLVIMLDRFEKLSSKRDTNIDLSGDFLWLCGQAGLIKRVPKVLWVIAGREELDWQEEDPKWKSFLKPFKLKPLNKDFTIKFLKDGGVSKEYHEDLYDLTEGIPEYLKLCVETARYTDENELNIDCFGKNQSELINRFFDHLSDNQVKVLTMLSCLEDWDDEMVAEVGPKSLSTFDNPTYRRIKKLSFINFDGRKYSMDRVIRDSLLEKLSKDDFELLYKTIKNSLEYLAKKGNRDEYGYIYEKVAHALEVYIDKEENNNRLEDFYIKYVKDTLFDMSRMGIKTATNVIFNKFYKRAEQSKNNIFKIYALYSHSFFLKNAGEYNTACDMGKKALDICEEEKLKEDDLLRLEVESNYIECLLHREGNITQSIELGRDIFTKREKELGANHEETLRAETNLAAGLSRLGEYNEAAKYGKEVLEKQEKHLGPNHPDTLRTKNNLAVFLSNLGNAVKALEYGNEVFYSRKVKLGEDHPDTLRAMSNIACFQSDLGKYEGAVEQDKKVLAKREIILGPNHPDTLVSKNNLSVHLSKLDRFGNALELDKEVLASRKNMLGVNHEKTLRAMRNLAIDLSSFGIENEEALRLFREVFARTKKKFGVNHPYTLQALRDLAMGVFNLGKGEGSIEESVKLHRILLERTKRIYGDEHPDTLEDMANLAFVLYYNRDYDESLQLHRKVLDKRKIVLGEDHPNTLEAMRNLSHYLDNDDEEAISLEREVLTKLREALAKCRKELSEDAPETLQAMKNLAAELSHSYYHRDYEEAIKLDREVLAKSIKTLSEDHPDTIQAMQNLSNDLSNLRKYDEAVKWERQVFDWCKKQLGEKHSKTLKAMENLSSDLYNFVQTLRIDENTVLTPNEMLGECLLVTLQSMRELAADYNNLNRYHDALFLEEAVLNMRREVLGENDPDTLQSKKDVGALSDLVRSMETASEEKTQLE